MLRASLFFWAIILSCALPARADYSATDLEAALAAAIQGDITPALALTANSRAGHFIPVPPEFPRKADVSLTDLRIPLAQLALATGANDQLQVLRAQRGARPVALSIRGGGLTLPELIKVSGALEHPYPIWGTYGVQLPIVIWPDAALFLMPGEALQLSRAHGAFLVNFGFLSAEGARISGTGEANANVPAFRPFLATAATGAAHISTSDIGGLGFGTTAAFSGISFTNGGVFLPPHQTIVSDNVFRDIGALSLRGTAGALVQRNLFQSADGPAIDLRSGQGAQLRSNVFAQTKTGPALRISHGTSSSEITENIFLKNPGTGIEVDGAGPGLLLRGNLIWSQGRAGLSVALTDCAQIAQNHLLSNGSKGMVLKTVRDIVVTGNTLTGNRTAGLAITQQEIGSHVQLLGNRFRKNRVGLTGASAAQLSLQDNDFSQQMPRILAGDIAAQTPQLLGDLRGAQPVVLTSSGLTPSRLPSPPCGQMRGAI